MVKWAPGLLMTLGGAFLGIGFLTPLAGAVLAFCFAGVAASSLAFPFWSANESRWIAAGMMATAAAIALLGPGAYSLDGRLFGRREIIIPPASRGREP